jgi:hypothetical protein
LENMAVREAQASRSSASGLARHSGREALTDRRKGVGISIPMSTACRLGPELPMHFPPRPPRRPVRRLHSAAVTWLALRRMSVGERKPPRGQWGLLDRVAFVLGQPSGRSSDDN